MRKILFFSVFAIFFSACKTNDVVEGSTSERVLHWDTLTGVNAGTLLRLDTLASSYISDRPLDVWLPSSYDGKRTHNILFMYDAQMLFDAKTTWNHQEWRVDEVLDSLIDAAAVFPTIVVGLHNGGVMRNFEYFPEDPYEHLEATFSDSTLKDIAKRYGSDTTFPVQSDAYLMYMVEEVLPLIHSNFSTYSDPENIAVMGSSMGGLMSMYAIGQYPEVFGSALCMSTHWPGGFKPNEEIPTVFQEYVAAHISADKVGKIYFDFGTETLDGMYEPFQQKVDSILRLNGFHYGENWLTWKFPGASHDEKSWAKRLHYPMMFAFSK